MASNVFFGDKNDWAWLKTRPCPLHEEVCTNTLSLKHRCTPARKAQDVEYA